VATRLYFPETQPAPVTPPAASGTDWAHINGITRALLLAPDGSALVSTAYTPDTSDHIVSANAVHRQYVSPPLDAQTLAGTVKMQFQGLMPSTNDAQFLTLKVLVCSRDGSSTVATLRALTRNPTSWLTSLTNRIYQAQTLTSFSCSQGDRLVLELGCGGLPTAAGGVQGHNCTIRWGCLATSGDLPIDGTTTATTFRPWVEFSNTFAFEFTGEDTNFPVMLTQFSAW
jgi:hypothetical protein